MLTVHQHRGQWVSGVTLLQIPRRWNLQSWGKHIDVAAHREEAYPLGMSVYIYTWTNRRLLSWSLQLPPAAAFILLWKEKCWEWCGGFIGNLKALWCWWRFARDTGNAAPLANWGLRCHDGKLPRLQKLSWAVGESPNTVCNCAMSRDSAKSPTVAEQYSNTHTERKNKRWWRTIRPEVGWKRGSPQKDLGTQKLYVKCVSTYEVLG